MDCTLEVGEDAVILKVIGRVDEATWNSFSEGLSGAVRNARDDGLTRLIVDLQQLAYMSSRGLRALTVAKREADEAGVNISLASPNDVMREILAISRYDKLFTVTDTAEAKR
ncbi:STAS domain-containing protein [Sphingomonas edaphi]|jgi:anti-anti-sigma factor|uniref:Anti-sigma factor antagonist n=1 Tax=Sphingomonas edaphi TaxID=2315689 RepID=A0A418Q067_9SPHN|nr:STAS domain-containing protein [Sphingomonas edaphi]RIX29259.1 anti-sigma factor antagonist [Sphingomonas edaphi]